MSGGPARTAGGQGGEESERQVQEVHEKDEGAADGRPQQSLLKGIKSGLTSLIAYKISFLARTTPIRPSFDRIIFY